MSTQADSSERAAQGTAGAGTRLPAIARYWWLTALRGLVALTLALAVTVGGPHAGPRPARPAARAAFEHW